MRNVKEKRVVNYKRTKTNVKQQQQHRQPSSLLLMELIYNTSESFKEKKS